MPRSKGTGTKRGKKSPKVFVLCNGQTAESTAFPLTLEEAQQSPTLEKQLKQNGPHVLELSGANYQNIQNIGEFLQLSASLSATPSLHVKFPLRSCDPKDAKDIVNREWADLLTRLTANSLSNALALMHCASILKLGILEELALIVVAMKIKGKPWGIVRHMLIHAG
jgi:hypothetical protein